MTGNLKFLPVKAKIRRLGLLWSFVEPAPDACKSATCFAETWARSSLAPPRANGQGRCTLAPYKWATVAGTEKTRLHYLRARKKEFSAPFARGNRDGNPGSSDSFAGTYHILVSSSSLHLYSSVLVEGTTVGSSRRFSFRVWVVKFEEIEVDKIELMELVIVGYKLCNGVMWHVGTREVYVKVEWIWVFHFLESVYQGRGFIIIIIIITTLLLLEWKI